jgi:hypothetical protein
MLTNSLIKSVFGFPIFVMKRYNLFSLRLRFILRLLSWRREGKERQRKAKKGKELPVAICPKLRLGLSNKVS